VFSRKSWFRFRVWKYFKLAPFIVLHTCWAAEMSISHPFFEGGGWRKVGLPSLRKIQQNLRQFYFRSFYFRCSRVFAKHLANYYINFHVEFFYITCIVCVNLNCRTCKAIQISLKIRTAGFWCVCLLI
jgi:hypothetical protein